MTGYMFRNAQYRLELQQSLEQVGLPDTQEKKVSEFYLNIYYIWFYIFFQLVFEIKELGSENGQAYIHPLPPAIFKSPKAKFFHQL